MKKYDSSYSIALDILKQLQGDGPLPATAANFAPLGYDKAPDSVVNGIKYGEQILADYDPDASLEGKFKDNRDIIFYPQTGVYNGTSMEQMFNNSSVQYVPKLDAHNVTTMKYMFSSCKNLTSIEGFTDTSNVTNMYGIFSGCSVLSALPDIDTHNVHIMDSMFNNCSELVTTPIIDLSSCTNTEYMFYGARPKLNKIIFTGDPSKLVHTNYMFGNGSFHLINNGTLIYDSRYDYTKIIDELHRYNPTWTAVPDNA